MRRAPERLLSGATIIFKKVRSSGFIDELTPPGGGGAFRTTAAVTGSASLARCADGSRFVSVFAIAPTT
jgi:hypothetical protein